MINIAKSNLQEKRYPGFKGGLNKLVSPTKIKDNELSLAENIQIIEDGIVSTRDGQSYYLNSTSGTTINCLYQFKKSDGTTQLIVKDSNGYLKKENLATSNFDTIASSPFLSSGDLTAVQAYDKIFFNNGIDPFFSYDGTNFVSYTSILSPSGVAAARSGTSAAGIYNYYYRVAAYNAAGETLASTEVNIAGGVDVGTLTTAKTITLSWSAVTGATGYVIYGRKTGNTGKLASVDSSQTSFIDDGSATQSLVFFPVEQNQTAGTIGTFMEFVNGTLIISGDSANPSRVYYSGPGINYVTTTSAALGGGYVDISRSDGENVTGIKAFQNQILIFKSNSVWSMTFSASGLPAITLISRSVGCVAPKSICIVENDVFFLSNRGFFVIGNEPNIVGVIRTNELSARIRPVIQGLNKGRLSKAVSAYFNNKFITFVSNGGSSYNDTAIVYDRERLCWYVWTNQNVRQLATYFASDGSYSLLAGQDNGGRIVKLFSGSDDFGTPISVRIATKQETLDRFEIYKNFQKQVFHFRDTIGNVSIKVLKDGTTVADTIFLPLNTSTTAKDSGLWGDLLWGDAPSSLLTTSNAEQTKRITKRYKAKGLSVQIEKSDFGGFTLLDYGLKAQIFGVNYFPSSEKVGVTSSSTAFDGIYDGGTF